LLGGLTLRDAAVSRRSGLIKVDDDSEREADLVFL
jgi:hypothetical protein